MHSSTGNMGYLPVDDQMKTSLDWFKFFTNDNLHSEFYDTA